jgi:uncharacterized membrane protein
MTMLIIACVIFVGGHILLSGTPLRGVIVGVIGETAFLGLFSVIALASIVFMAWAYADTDYVELWYAGHALKGIAWLIMVPAVIWSSVAMPRQTPRPWVRKRFWNVTMPHAASSRSHAIR